jgi:hypothetical protein
MTEPSVEELVRRARALIKARGRPLRSQVLDGTIFRHKLFMVRDNSDCLSVQLLDPIREVYWETNQMLGDCGPDPSIAYELVAFTVRAMREEMVLDDLSSI